MNTMSLHNIVGMRIERKCFGGSEGFNTASVIFTDTRGGEFEVCAFTGAHLEFEQGKTETYALDGKPVKEEA